MAEDQKRFYEELQNTWNELKSTLDEKDSKNAETLEKVDRMNARLDELETKLNRPIVQGDKALNGDLNEYIDPYSKGNCIIPGLEPAQHKQIFLKALRKGYAFLDKDERKAMPKVSTQEAKAMTLGDDSTGGWLAYPQLVQDIIKGQILFSPIRQYATVKTTSNRSIKQPVRKGTFSAQWVSEVGQRAETPGLKYGLEDIPNHEMYCEVLISEQDLEDSAFNLEAEINSEASTQFGVAEGLAFVSGNGVGKPEGLLTASGVTNFPSLDANKVTGDGLLNMVYGLKEYYTANARFALKRQTIGAIRVLKDQYGDYIWQPGLSQGAPSQILGYPYFECVDMPDVGAGNVPILFGDFARGYVIVDRVQMVVKRLIEKYAEEGEIAIMFRKRVGGQVILPEALVKMTVSAS